MKKVAIYGQSYTVGAHREINILLEALKQKNVEIFLEHEFLKALKKEVQIDNYPVFTNYKDLNSSFDVFFSLGGDGTMLRAVTYIRDSGIPVLGINTGRLGFLATVKKNEILEAVDVLMTKNYRLQERSLLQVETFPHNEEVKDFCFALNEITIARKNTTSMIGVKTFLNQEYLTNYWSDGLIVATPTGSTGYSLSCNGPVISPNSKSFVITPIAPHNLNARPMVIPDDTVIELQVDAREKSFLISLDSRIKSLPKNTKITVRKASFCIKSIVPQNQSFLQTLRSKLLWGEDTRNESNQ